MISGCAQQLVLDTELPAANVEDSISTILSRAFAVLKACVSDATGASAQELALRVELPVRTVALLLAELQHSGFVTRMDGEFRLGPALVDVGPSGEATAGSPHVPTDRGESV